MLKSTRLRAERDAEMLVLLLKIVHAEKRGDPELAKKLRAEKAEVVNRYERDIDFFETRRIMDAANSLDVELPDTNDTAYWFLPPPRGGY
jgi:hypothetical protein